MYPHKYQTGDLKSGELPIEEYAHKKYFRNLDAWKKRKILWKDKVLSLNFCRKIAYILKILMGNINDF